MGRMGICLITATHWLGDEKKLRSWLLKKTVIIDVRTHDYFLLIKNISFPRGKEKRVENFSLHKLINSYNEKKLCKIVIQMYPLHYFVLSPVDKKS